MNYTKGEWEVYLSNDGETRYITTRDKPGRPNKVIARLISGLKEEEANANLIAAAPEMYEALKEAKERYGNYDPFWCIKVSNILAKAKGR